MATLESAEKLLTEMRDVAYPAAVKDLAELREFAKSQGEAEELQVGWAGRGWGMECCSGPAGPEGPVPG
jgi:hypothetical protein